MCVIAVGLRSNQASAEPAPAKPDMAIELPKSCPSDAVLTSAGCVLGTKLDKLAVFRGIPYAAPPVGELRWKPPAQPPRWKGVRTTTAFGKSCPQADSTLGGKLDTNEDCLTLNIWTPSTRVRDVDLIGVGVQSVGEGACDHSGGSALAC